MFLNKRNQGVSFLTPLIFILFLLIAQIPISVSLQTQALNKSKRDFEEGFGWNPDLFRILTFGHSPVAVDILLMKFLQEDRLAHVKDGEHAGAFFSIDLASDIDRRFYDLYFSGANYLTVVRNDNDGAIRILNKATDFIEKDLPFYSEEFRQRFWTRPWRVYLVKGYVSLFELRKIEDSARAYQKLADYSDVPMHLRNLGHSMSTYSGMLEVAHRTLLILMDQAKDDLQKERLMEKVKDVEVNHYLYSINEEYLKTKVFPQVDPWGGSLKWNSERHEIETTTAFQKFDKF